MIDIEMLFKSKHIKICGNKYFGYTCVVRDGISELHSIKVFGKGFYLPHKLRKLLRAKNGHSI